LFAAADGQSTKYSAIAGTPCASLPLASPSGVYRHHRSIPLRDPPFSRLTRSTWWPVRGTAGLIVATRDTAAADCHWSTVEGTPIVIIEGREAAGRENRPAASLKIRQRLAMQAAGCPLGSC
jgi:hypothetical protein